MGDLHYNEILMDVENGESNGKDEELLFSSFRQPLLRNRGSSHHAIVGANLCPIQSLDYEIIENELFKEDWRSRKKVQIIQYVFLKWAFALLIGLFTGLVGFFNNIAVENIAGFKLLLTNNLMSEGKYLKAFLAFAGCNIGLAAAAGALCAYVAPAAAGSGIPEVKAYLNGVDAPSILAPTTLFVKIFGSVLGVSGGFVIGKEGPMVHTGACIANLLGQGGSKKYGLTWSWLRYFNNDRDRRDLITCGAAAGVAAAFRAPVGGVLYALEEAASWWRSALLWRTFFSTAVVAMVMRGFIQLCWSGKCGLFGKGGVLIYVVSDTETIYKLHDLVTVIFLGVTGGLFGSLFNYLVDKVLRFYTFMNEKGPSMRVIMVIGMSILTSCCAFALPWIAKCTACPTDANEKCPSVSESGKYKSFQCPPGHYNDLASLYLNTNDNAIRNLLSTNSTGLFQTSSLVVFFITIYTLGIMTYGIAIPAGLFIPVIMAGAAYGRLVGSVLGDMCGLDTGLISLLGAASFLGGTMRMTVSLCVILLELTSDLLLLPLIMLVLVISKTVADAFNRGIYEQIVKLKGLPFMEAHPESYMKHLIAGDVVSAGPLIKFSVVEKVENIVHALQGTTHNGFPVVCNGATELCGLVLRSHLLVLLKAKCYSNEIDILNTIDFAKPGSGKELRLEDISIDEEDMEMYIDLHPITNTSPYTVVETMSLAKAQILFRQLGLRHMCVVPKKTQGGPPIVGILTRHDFMPDHILGLYPRVKSYK